MAMELFIGKVQACESLGKALRIGEVTAYRHAHKGLLRLNDFTFFARHDGGCAMKELRGEGLLMELIRSDRVLAEKKKDERQVKDFTWVVRASPATNSGRNGRTLSLNIWLG